MYSSSSSSSNSSLVLPTNRSSKYRPFPPIQAPKVSHLNPYEPHQKMWRSIAKQASSRNIASLPRTSLQPNSFFLGSSQNIGSADKILPFDHKPRLIPGVLEMGFCRNRGLSSPGEDRVSCSRDPGVFAQYSNWRGDSELKNGVKCGFSAMGSRRNGELSSFGGCSRTLFNFSGLPNRVVGFASVAEAVSSTDAEDEVSVVEEMRGLLQKISNSEQRGQRLERPTGGKHLALRRRQVKVETEAWDQAAKEYQELLADMCEQKLAPNLPYMKSLFLGWFETLRDCIAKDQEQCREGKCKAAYAPYFDHLPPEMMAVITIHKLMALLMTGGVHGSARVVQAAINVGEAIEHEVRIHKFLEKTRKKHDKEKKIEGVEPDSVSKEQEYLRKRVTNLLKKQKVCQVKDIVKRLDDLKPWGQEAQAKVGSRLIEMLIDTAYIQPPVDQLADGPPDIRPAVRHHLKTVTKEQQKGLISLFNYEFTSYFI